MKLHIIILCHFWNMQSRLFYMYFIWTLVERLISRWALNTMTNIVLFLASEQTHSALVVCHSEWVTACSFTVRATASSDIQPSGYSAVRLVPRETAAVSAHVLCRPCATLQCYFIRSHIRRVPVCFSVTCHLSFGRMTWTGIFHVLLR